MCVSNADCLVLHGDRLGWLPATATIALLTLLTIYSSVLLLRLYQAVPNTVLFGDIGQAAAGPWVSACLH